MNQMRHFTFFENWWDMAMSKDTDEKRLAFYDAITNYAFAGVIPQKPIKGESHGPDWAAWDAYNAIKPVLVTREIKAKAGQIGGLSQSSRKAEAARRNGALGGRPPKPKQETEAITETINKNKINKSKINEVVVAATPSTTTSVLDAQADEDAAMMNRPTKSQVLSAAGLMGIKPDVVDRWLVHMRQWEWHFSDGGCVTLRNFRTSLQSFAARERRECNEASLDAPNIPPVTETQRARMKRLNEVLNI